MPLRAEAAPFVPNQFIRGDNTVTSCCQNGEKEENTGVNDIHYYESKDDDNNITEKKKKKKKNDNDQRRRRRRRNNGRKSMDINKNIFVNDMGASDQVLSCEIDRNKNFVTDEEKVWKNDSKRSLYVGKPRKCRRGRRNTKNLLQNKEVRRESVVDRLDVDFNVDNDSNHEKFPPLTMASKERKSEHCLKPERMCWSARVCVDKDEEVNIVSTEDNTNCESSCNGMFALHKLSGVTTHISSMRSKEPKLPIIYNRNENIRVNNVARKCGEIQNEMKLFTFKNRQWKSTHAHQHWSKIIQEHEERLRECISSNTEQSVNSSSCNCQFDIVSHDDSSSSISTASEESNMEWTNTIESYLDCNYPLHLAIAKDDFRGVKSLLPFVKVEAATSFENFICGTNGLSMQSIERMIPLRSRHSKWSAYHVCIILDRPHLLHVLLEHDCNIIAADAKSRSGSLTLLQLACMFGREGCVQVLLEYGSTKSIFVKHDETGNNAIHMGCKYGYLSTLRRLLRCCLKTLSHKHLLKCLCQQNKNLETPLHLACQNRHASIVEYIFSSWSHFLPKVLNIEDISGKSPLIVAVESNSVEIVTLILMNLPTSKESSFCGKKSPSHGTICPLITAVRMHSFPMVQLLFQFFSKTCFSLSSIFDNALMEAVKLRSEHSDYKNIITYLIKSGAKPHASSDFTGSPLLHVALSGDLNLLTVMMDMYLEARLLMRSHRETACKQAGHSLAFFDEIDNKEEKAFDSTAKEVLVATLVQMWKHFNESRSGLALNSAGEVSLSMLRRGVFLSDSCLMRLLKTISNNGETGQYNLKLITNHRWQASYPDMGDNGLATENKYVYSAKKISFWTKIYFSLPFVKMYASRNNIYCRNVRDFFDESRNEKYSGETLDFPDDWVNLVIQGKKLLVHKTIISCKSEKLAAAIEFQSRLKSGVKDENKILEVQIDLEMRLMLLLLEHCYIGSIVSMLPSSHSECNRVLLELALVANEFICPSLLSEIEMRLLSSSPYSCFCRSCSQITNTLHVRTTCEGPSSLITGKTALDVISIAQNIGSSPLNINDCFRIKVRDCDIFNLSKHDEYDKISLWQSPSPFYIARKVACKYVLQDYIEVEKSDTFYRTRDSVEEDFTGTQFACQLLLFCLEELCS